MTKGNRRASDRGAMIAPANSIANIAGVTSVTPSAPAAGSATLTLMPPDRHGGPYDDDDDTEVWV